MLLEALPIDDKRPVNYVCFHPIAAGHLQNGKTHNDFDGEKYEPSCLAVEYEYESVLQAVCVALGWQGGTIHQAIDEVKRLKAIAPVESKESAGTSHNKQSTAAAQIADEMAESLRGSALNHPARNWIRGWERQLRTL